MSAPAAHDGGEAYERLIAALPEPLLTARADGLIEAANVRAEGLLRAAHGALAGRNLVALAAPEEGAAKDFLRAAARTRAMLPGVLALACTDGQRVRLRAEGALIDPAAAGQPARLLVRFAPADNVVTRFAALNLRIDDLNREVGRRRLAEQALRESSELLRVTLSSIGDAVIATDAAGRVTFMNSVAESQTGWPHAEAVGRALEDVFVIVNESTRAVVESPVAQVLRQNVTVGLANHTVLIRRDGQEVPIDDSGAPIRDASGRVLGVVLVFRDVTERRVRERERIQADRRREEFLAMLAHELRNPLAAIASGAELVRRTRGARSDRPDAGIAEAGEIMHRQLRHLARLVDDLLDASRATRGMISLRRAPLFLRTVIEDVVAAHRPAFEAGGIRLALELPEQLLQLHGDAERLSQLFGNLLANAVKFSRRGGRVRVVAAGEGRWARVQVADEGEGMAPELLPRIFDLFTQGDNSPARSRGGLGVGLTIAKLIAELHGGRIEAASEGLGRGAAFTVYLPLAVSEAAHASSTAERRGEGRKRRVLVVDDNPDAAATLAALLQLEGHHVRTAQNGEAALRLQHEEPAEILLLDLGMPGMDGYELARRLRRRGERDSLLLIALTGYGNADDRRRAIEAGFDAHLTKPVDLQALEDLLR